MCNETDGCFYLAVKETTYVTCRKSDDNFDDALGQAKNTWQETYLPAEVLREILHFPELDFREYI